MAECKCGGRGFNVVDGVKVLCDCFASKKAKVYLRKLGDELTPPVDDKILALNGDENLLVEVRPATTNAEFKGMIAHLLLKKGMGRSYLYFNSYEFLDIYLGHHPEYTSLLAMSADILIVDYGFSEFENKRQADSINQVLCHQLKKNKLFWLFSLGVFPFVTTKDLCESKKFTFVTY